MSLRVTATWYNRRDYLLHWWHYHASLWQRKLGDREGSEWSPQLSDCQHLQAMLSILFEITRMRLLKSCFGEWASLVYVAMLTSFLSWTGLTKKLHNNTQRPCDVTFFSRCHYATCFCTKMPCCCQVKEDRSQWFEMIERQPLITTEVSRRLTLNAQGVEPWSRWATAVQDNTGCHV